VHLGYGSFGEYIERLFGYKPRSTQEKLRVAEALEELPAIAQALASGALNWSAARELTRGAVAETESAWLDVARVKTVHQLEALVAGKSPGDGPSSAGNPDARRHVLRFEVAPETVALFREAMNKLKRSGTPLDDDSALMLMARHVLGGRADEGRASYQIAVAGAEPAKDESAHVGAEPAKNEGAHVGARVRAITSGASSLVAAMRGFSMFITSRHVRKVAGMMPTI
jgi:hypothetical protein